MTVYLILCITVQFLIGFFIRTVHCYDKVTFRRQHCKYLANSIGRVEKVGSEAQCGSLCSKEHWCTSVNYKTSGEHQGMCELNQETLESSPESVHKSAEYVYLELIRRTCQNPDEIFSQNAKQCIPRTKSCKELRDKVGPIPDGVYNLIKESQQKYPVYCYMNDIPGCGAEGWTLALKVDGSKETFRYDAVLWTDKITYNVQGGLEGLTDTESKLESYWNTPFTKLCVGMKVNGETRWIKLEYEATSLHSVIADGKFRATNAGRAAWKSLIEDSSLQLNCNIEGFNFSEEGGGNIFLRIRLGHVANEKDHCFSCNSWVGFGVIHGKGSKSTGNYAKHGGDNGDKDTSAIGYILVA